MKKILTTIAAFSLILNSASAVVINLAGIANTTIGLITTGSQNSSGRAIFVSTTDALVTESVTTELNKLLAVATSTPANFDTTLAALLPAITSTSPGIVRTNTFTSGALGATGTVELGNVGNRVAMFLVSEANGFITGIGAYTNTNTVPSLGAVTFNPTLSNDTFSVGTSISGFQLAAAIPEASTSLFGAIGALALLRRRRN